MEGLEEACGAATTAQVLGSIADPEPPNGYGETQNIVVADYEPASSEAFILQDLDAYWEDVNARLTVSRMVGNSVIKGIVTAISEEAAEKTAAMETQIAALTDRLIFSKTNAYNFNSVDFCGVGAKIDIDKSSFEGKLNDIQEHLQTICLLLEKHLESLERSLQCIRDSSGTSSPISSSQGYQMEENVCMLRKLLASSTQHVQDICLFTVEHKWKHDLEDEIVTAVISNCCKEFQDMLCDHNIYILHRQNENDNLKMDQLQNVRQELDAIAKSLDSPEIGRLQSHGSHEGVEEWTHRKVLGYQFNDNGFGELDKLKTSASVLMEPAYLKRMSHEELINHFHIEMTKLKRSHESTVQEITEEYFRLKGAYLKEKDSFHAKKDKELDTLMKKIPKILLQVDCILAEDKHPSSFPCNYDNIQSDRINALLLENQTLQDLLKMEKAEVSKLASKIPNSRDKTSLHSSGPSLVKEVDQLKGFIDDREIEGSIQEEVYRIFAKEIIGEVACGMDLHRVEAVYKLETFYLVYKEAISRNADMVDTMEKKYNNLLERNKCLENILLETNNTLEAEVKEKDTVKLELLSLSSAIKEKQILVLETGSSLTEHKKQLEQATQEVERLKEKISLQEKVISENSKELETVKCKLLKDKDKLDWYKGEMDKAVHKLQIAEAGLHEAEREKALFCNIIREKESSLSTSLSNQHNQRKQINSVIVLVQDMSKVTLSLEQRMSEVVKQKNARLDMLIHQVKPCIRRANELTKRVLLYKQVLERRCSDLDKAENEVDLLADEVDALLSLLEKIYIVLDHYSPVLQHYTGIMEILKLIKNELTGGI